MIDCGRPPANDQTILAFDVIHSRVILMACAFRRPEDLCNPLPHKHCRQSCIGPPAQKRHHQDDNAEWYTALEMLAQFGEASDDEEFLAFGGSIDFLVFEDPGVAVGNEDRIKPGG